MDQRALPSRPIEPPDLAMMLDQIVDVPEFSRFHAHAEEVKDEVRASDLARLKADVARKALEATERESQSWTETRRGRRRRFVVAGAAWLACLALSLVVAYLALTWLFDFAWLQEPAWLQQWWQRLVALVPCLIGALITYSLGADVVETLRGSKALDQYRRERATGELQNYARAQLTAAYTRAVNTLFASQGLTSFPLQAPRLVELNSAKIVPSKTIAYIRDFIESHATSAIGIAGPRGVGKSTLLRAIASKDFAQVIVAVPTSVKYDDLDFIRRLARAIISSLNGDENARDIHTWQYERAASRRRQAVVLRGTASMAALGLGGAIIYIDLLDLPLFQRLGAAAVVGALLVVAGTVGYFATLASLRSRRVGSSEGYAEDMAHALLDDLQFEAETTDSTKGSVSINSILAMERSRAEARRTRSMTYGDLVDRVRTLLRALGESVGEDGRVVIVVDELDKLNTVEGLIQTVNALKDLFHLEHVHFIVTVSDEALNSFQMRGLTERDAFDSSFDTVVRVERLTVEESLEVMNSRVTAFPEELALLCHVWSGGLPRDLLRGARSCVEHYRETPLAFPRWQDLGRGFLEQDLEQRMRAMLSVAPANDLEASLRVQRLLRSWLASDVKPPELIDWHDFPPAAAALAVFAASCFRTMEVLIAGQADPSVPPRSQIEGLGRGVAGLTEGTQGLAAAAVACGLNQGSSDEMARGTAPAEPSANRSRGRDRRRSVRRRVNRHRAR
ncbi:P-loop NTPase fold protein [Terrabacter sp. Soil811]|uniref:P-loop NTPase fold protein n=1 Tax=Terrabacter sp. Soil811 TaxID=1736419 RepID=UPI0012E37CD9|nr:P-loop NTPase fold protein [Terrabacter sp. Soil811]